MQRGIYAGSFDPVTLGHLDIITRASKIVDELVVGILENPNKNCLFTIEERKKHLCMVTKELKNVRIESFRGLLADFAHTIGANLAIRGLRTSIDFESEFQMYLINRKLDPSIETIFIASDEKHLSLSSSAVKEVATFGGTIDFMVPAQIKEFVVEKYKK